MSIRELPMLRRHGANGHQQQPAQRPNHTRATGSAHRLPRDAYRDVPILQQPTWGHEIAAYFYFGGISSGAYTLGSLLSIFGGPKQRHLARTAHYVSLVTLLPCPPLLIADLGRPSRFHHMLRIFKPSSPMNLGAWTLTMHGGFAALSALGSLAQQRRLPIVGTLLRLLPERVTAATGTPTALTLGGYTGVLLGTTSVPLWYTSPLLGGLFMASSLSSGVAAVSLAAEAFDRENSGAQETLVPMALAAGIGEAALLGGYLVTSGAAAKPLLRGKQGLLLAGAGAALGLAAVLDMATLRQSTARHALSTAASVAALVASAALRTAIVEGGKVSANDREGTLEAMSPSDSAPGWGPHRP